MAQNALEKSRGLLKEVIGEANFRRFEAAMSIQIEDPDENMYVVTRVSDGVSICRHQPGESNWGDLYHARGLELYDGLASLVMSIKLGKVDWGCGSLSITLPQTMPDESPERMNENTDGRVAIDYDNNGMYKPDYLRRVLGRHGRDCLSIAWYFGPFFLGLAMLPHLGFMALLISLMPWLFMGVLE